MRELEGAEDEYQEVGSKRQRKLPQRLVEESQQPIEETTSIVCIDTFPPLYYLTVQVGLCKLHIIESVHRIGENRHQRLPLPSKSMFNSFHHSFCKLILLSSGGKDC